MHIFNVNVQTKDFAPDAKVPEFYAKQLTSLALKFTNEDGTPYALSVDDMIYFVADTDFNPNTAPAIPKTYAAPADIYPDDGLVVFFINTNTPRYRTAINCKGTCLNAEVRIQRGQSWEPLLFSRVLGNPMVVDPDAPPEPAPLIEWVQTVNGLVGHVDILDADGVPYPVDTSTNSITIIGGGQDYIPGTGIDITDEVISVTSDVAFKSDITSSVQAHNESITSHADIRIQLNAKADTVDVVDALDHKVDKDGDKQLSDNNFSDADKNKVDSLGSMATETASDYRKKTDQDDIDNGKVDKNQPITAATSTKVTYDSSGLILSGASLVETDIPEIGQSKVTGLVLSLSGKVDRDGDKVLSDNNFTDTYITAISDLQTTVSTLMGAVVLIGEIALYEPTQEQLTARAIELRSQVQLGDTLVDLDKIEWYYDGTGWNNIGQNVISKATSTVPGVVKGSDVALEVAVGVDGAMSVNGLSDALNGKVDKESGKSLMLNSDKTKLDNYPTTPDDFAIKSSSNTFTDSQVISINSENSLELKSTSNTSYSRIKYTGNQRVFTSGVGNSSATIEGLRNKFYIYDFTAAAIRLTIDANGGVYIPETLSVSSLFLHDNSTGTEYGLNTAGGLPRIDVTTGKLIPDIIPDIGIPEAPEDGKTYGRKDGGWSEVTGEERLMKSINQITATDNGKVYAPEYDTNGRNYDSYPEDLFATQTTSSGTTNMAEGQSLHTGPVTLPNASNVSNSVPVWATGAYSWFSGSVDCGIFDVDYRARPDWTIETYVSFYNAPGTGLFRPTSTSVGYPLYIGGVDVIDNTAKLRFNGGYPTSMDYTTDRIVGDANGFFHFALQCVAGVVYLFIHGVLIKTFSESESGIIRGALQWIYSYGSGLLLSTRFNMSRAIYPVSGFTPPQVAFGPGVTQRNTDKLLIDVMSPETANELPTGVIVPAWDSVNKKWLDVDAVLAAKSDLIQPRSTEQYEQILVGPTRQYTTLGAAYAYMQTKNQGSKGFELILDPGTYSDEVTMDDSLIYLHGADSANLPVISGILTLTRCRGTISAVKFAARLIVSYGGNINVNDCTFDHNDTNIQATYSSNVFLRSCTFIGHKDIAATQIAIYAVSRSSIFAVQSLSFDNFGTAVTVQTSSFALVPGVSMTNVTTDTSPAANTVGNGNSYIFM